MMQCQLQLLFFHLQRANTVAGNESVGRRKKEEGRRKKEEGRRKKEEGRRKKEEGRGKDGRRSRGRNEGGKGEFRFGLLLSPHLFIFLSSSPLPCFFLLVLLLLFSSSPLG